MTNFLSIENLTKSYGDRLIFGDITFGVDEGDKIGIIAKNGTGKTTLLRVLAGVESADSGNIVYRNGLRVGYLEQTPHFRAGSTVIESALDSDDAVPTAVRRYEKAIASGSEHERAEAIHLMDNLSAWDYQDRLRQMLTRLELPDIHACTDTLSGGQRKRLAIARELMRDPELLMLDEPTNHLDIATVEWLENYLRRSRTTLLMITHDRYFLDRVCTRIIELDNSCAYSYDGNYDYYLRRRAERIEAMTAELARVKNTLRREQEWMSRQPQARAGKAKFRIDSFYELKERSRVNLTEKNVSLDAKSSYIGSKIFEAENICKSFGDKKILDNFSYTFARGEKLGIIGHNGVGKSTFIKMLQGIVPSDSGEWNVGTTVRFGYYSQEGIKFDANKKVIDAVTEIAEDIRMAEGLSIAPMQYLQRFLFSPADQQKYIHTLSGGERCRLHLAVVLMQQPNFLILDEPTNDLDIVTLGILEEFLADFKGCVIVVSHDRYFLDNVIDHIFVMEGDGVVRDFPGNYSDYRAWLDLRNKEIADAGKKDRPAPKGAPQEARKSQKVKLTYRERQEFEALAGEIEELTAEKDSLEEFFNSGCSDDIAAKSKRYEEVRSILDEKEMRWLELSEKA